MGQKSISGRLTWSDLRIFTARIEARTTGPLDFLFQLVAVIDVFVKPAGFHQFFM